MLGLFFFSTGDEKTINNLHFKNLFSPLLILPHSGKIIPMKRKTSDALCSPSWPLALQLDSCRGSLFLGHELLGGPVSEYGVASELDPEEEYLFSCYLLKGLLLPGQYLGLDVDMNCGLRDGHGNI